MAVRDRSSKLTLTGLSSGPLLQTCTIRAPRRPWIQAVRASVLSSQIVVTVQRPIMIQLLGFSWPVPDVPSSCSEDATRCFLYGVYRGFLANPHIAGGGNPSQHIKSASRCTCLVSSRFFFPSCSYSGFYNFTPKLEFHSR